MELTQWHLWFKRRGGRELRDLLLHEWDPIGVLVAPEAVDEYNGYLGPIAERLRLGAKSDEIAAMLGSYRTQMGLRPEVRADRRVAEVLIPWYAKALAAAGHPEEIAEL
jgi:hypothetical protein